MKKVLLISLGNDFGGIEQFELQLLNNMHNYEVEILTSADVFDTNDKRINTLNIKRNNLINKIKYNHKLKEYLLNNKYDIVHINSSVYLSSYFISRIAKKCGVKKVIAHSHSIPHMSLLKKIIMKVTNKKYINKVDLFLSCSEISSRSLLIDKYRYRNIVIKNGIDLNSFKFDSKIRKEIRKKLNINKEIVIGNVGRFEEEKNQLYLIELFNEIHKINKETILVLIGDGSLKEECIKKVNDYKLSKNVRFIDFKDNINDYYNAFDVYVSPSIKEGFGLSLLEAETNGLVCYCSNTIPKETIVTDKCFSFDLKDDISIVAKNILSNCKSDNREESYTIVKKSGYDILDVVKKIENEYDLLNEIKTLEFNKTKGYLINYYIYSFIKRIIDIILSLFGIIILLPFMIIIGIIIKMDSKGPILFKQVRTGYKGKNFKILKFRTFRDKEDKQTRVGLFLRKTSIDEIPQIFNVLIGQMSFVGPRPWITDYFKVMNDKEKARFDVRPGITGLAQVKGRNNISIFEKINYDIEYVRDYSILEDIKIILLTIKTVICKTGVEASEDLIKNELKALKDKNKK